jgi:hypothetical protein
MSFERVRRLIVPDLCSTSIRPFRKEKSAAPLLNALLPFPWNLQLHCLRMICLGATSSTAGGPISRFLLP